MMKVTSQVQNVKQVTLRLEIEATVQEWQVIQNFIEEEAVKKAFSPLRDMYNLIRNSLDPLFQIVKVDQQDLHKVSDTKSEPT